MKHRRKEPNCSLKDKKIWPFSVFPFYFTNEKKKTSLRGRTYWCLTTFITTPIMAIVKEGTSRLIQTTYLLIENNSNFSWLEISIAKVPNIGTVYFLESWWTCFICYEYKTCESWIMVFAFGSPTHSIQKLIAPKKSNKLAKFFQSTIAIAKDGLKLNP